MRLFSLTSLLTGAGLSVAACCCNGPTSQSSLAFADEAKAQGAIIEKTYIVEGMFCGGCRRGVEAALMRVPGVQEAKARITDLDKKMGHATVKIKKDQDKGKETDCKIVKQIRDDLGYTAYLKGLDRTSCKL